MRQFKTEMLTELKELIKPGQAQIKQWLKKRRSAQAAEHLTGYFATFTVQKFKIEL